MVIESLQSFCVVANQSSNTQKYLTGKAYILSNSTKMCFAYDSIKDKLTRLADKPSRMGFHKAVIIERRNKPFIYSIGGFCTNFGYCVTEKYHVQKDIWKYDIANHFYRRIAPKTVDRLVNMSLFYFEGNDTLYAFGGIKFPSNSTKVVSSKANKSQHKKFAIQKLKIKGSDDRPKWEAVYYKSNLPFTNLYINTISENAFIIFGQPCTEYESDAKTLGFFYTQFDELEDFKNDIIYLEEHGFDDSEDDENIDALDTSDQNLKDFEKIINIEDKIQPF